MPCIVPPLWICDFPLNVAAMTSVVPVMVPVAVRSPVIFTFPVMSVSAVILQLDAVIVKLVHSALMSPDVLISTKPSDNAILVLPSSVCIKNAFVSLPDTVNPLTLSGMKNPNDNLCVRYVFGFDILRDWRNNVISRSHAIIQPVSPAFNGVLITIPPPPNT